MYIYICIICNPEWATCNEASVPQHLQLMLIPSVSIRGPVPPSQGPAEVHRFPTPVNQTMQKKLGVKATWLPPTGLQIIHNHPKQISAMDGGIPNSNPTFLWHNFCDLPRLS